MIWQKISRALLRLFGWRVTVTVPDYPKCIICVAPHTSNWDFVLGKLAYASVGRKAGFLMKDSWFFFPLGCLWRAIGGIPVVRRPRADGERPSLVDTVVGMFRQRPRMAVAITPEGTRSRTDRWHTGFLHIARQADVPVLLGVIDYPTRTITITDEFIPTGSTEADLEAIKRFYRPFTGRHPEKFSTGNA